MEKRNEPLLLRPAGKDYLWGGKRLNDEYGKNIELSPLAETWECSTHPDGVSTVCCGTFDKMELTAVIKAHPEYLGERHKGETTLPILVKLIDARKDLSVQVHPDDDYAKMKEHGQLGKTEMWYVLDAARDAKLTPFPVFAGRGYNRRLYGVGCSRSVYIGDLRIGCVYG